MRKYYLLITLIIPFNTCWSQVVALTTEISSRNGVIYHKGSPLSGELYEYNENAKTNCSCTKKYLLTNGIYDGKGEEWYVTGQKRFEGLFINGQKEGKHTVWTATGQKELEETYHKGKQTSIRTFYPSGNVKEYKEIEVSSSPSHLKKMEQYADNKANTLLKEYNYTAQMQRQGVQKEFYESGIPKIYENYDNGSLVEKKTYSSNGTLLSSTTKKGNHLYSESYYENGNLNSTGYYFKSNKDSLWVFYSSNNEKIKEESYKNNRLTRTGSYSNNQKTGEWNYYFSDGDTQKVEQYQSGALIDTKTFKSSHLLQNHFPNSKKNLLIYSPNSNIKNYVVIEKDNSNFVGINQNISDKIVEELSKRLKQQPYTEDLKHETIYKIVSIENVSIKYKESNYQTTSGKQEKGYDAYLNFDLKLLNADKKTETKKSFSINESGKFLNTLFNSMVQTYARTKEIAFKRSLEKLDISEFLYENFPMPEDENLKKRK